MKRQYIVPELSIELLEAVQNTMWAGSDGKVNGMDPGAPARNGDGSSVKLTKMYI